MGDFVFVSGQIGLDPATGALVSGGVAEETDRAMKNLAAILAAADASFEGVVKTTIYLVDMGDFEKVNEVYAKYFVKSYPARATVAVAGLPRGARVEIDAVVTSPAPMP